MILPTRAHIFAALACCLLLAACGSGKRGASTEAGAPTGDILYKPSLASGFVVLKCPQGKILKVFDPWQGARSVEFSLLIADPGAEAPEGFDGVTVTAPLKRVVCMSSSFVAFIAALGSEDAIKGVSGTGFISTPSVAELISRKEIADVGYDHSMNFELILSLKPDLVLTYGVYGENKSLSDRLREMGVKVFCMGDYVENSPLGRAEWIVPFGYLMGKEERAIKIFDTIMEQYMAASEGVEITGAKPEVMLNAPWRDSWFVPGDRNYMVQLINDAGGLYACRGEDTESSRAISAEAAYTYASRADVWLNPGSATTLAELTRDNPRFASIKAVKEGRVFNNNLRRTPMGGSDFWEGGTVNPHIALRDMISILHPGAIPGHELYYFRHLE